MSLTPAEKVDQPFNVRCARCREEFDLFGFDGQVMMGADEGGFYMEHVPCGHRGRRGDRGRQAAGWRPPAARPRDLGVFPPCPGGCCALEAAPS